MNNVSLKLLNIVGVSKELNGYPYFNADAWSQVGTFDLTDGSDSDTRMGRVVYGGGSRVVYYTAEGAGATINFQSNTPEDIGPINIISGRKYVVKFFISGWQVDDETVNGTTATVYLGPSNIGTNALSATNRSGLIEGVVTASGGTDEVHISGFSDTFGSFTINYLSIKEYDENKIYDTIDLYEDLAFPITYQIDDISSPERRKTSFSKTITIPGTKNNNIIFQNIFDIETDTKFNPNKKIDVVVYNDTYEVFRGILKLDKIIHSDKSMIEYQITLLSSISDIFTMLGDSELTDLDFSEYNHTYNAAEQVNSWGPEYGATSIKRFGSPYQNFYVGGPNNNKPKGEGYLYCLINNGKGTMLDFALAGNINLAGPVFRTEDIFPGIYLREYLTKIFRSVNKRWTSSLFDSIMFRKLVIPFNGDKIELTAAQIETRKFLAKSNPKEFILNYSNTNSGIIISDTIKYNNDSSGGAFDNTGSFDVSGDGVWYVNKGGTYNFTVNVGLNWNYYNLKNYDGTDPDVSNPVFTNFYGEHIIKIVKITTNGVLVTLSETNFTMERDPSGITSATGSSSVIHQSVVVSNADLKQGDQVYVVIDYKHLIQTDFTNSLNGIDVSTISMFYQPLPALYTPAVKGILSNSPLFNNNGDRWLVYQPDSGDDWFGHEGQIAQKNSGPGWTYFTPPLFSQLFIQDVEQYWLKFGSSGFQWQGVTVNGNYSDSPYTFMPTYWRPGASMNWSDYGESSKQTLGGSVKLVLNSTTFDFYNDVVNNGITDGSFLDLNSCVPQRIKQRDILNTVLKMFNCFMVEDKTDPNNIIIEPRDDFYTNEVVDTWKFDLSKPIEILPLSELDFKQFNFTYTQDSDYINKNYVEKYSSNKLPFGSYSAKYDNDFIDGVKEIKSIFSPTPVWRVYPQKAALPSIITDDNKPLKSNIRLLFYNGQETREPAFTHMYQGLTQIDVTSRYVPSLNMWDDMFAPNNSLMWGNSGTSYYWYSSEPNKTYLLSMSKNTLYNKYYSSYMRAITDKNSKLIRAYVKLNMVDINKLDFSKLYFIDNHWLRLYRVIDNNTFLNETTLCEFLKYNEGRAFTGQYASGVSLTGGNTFAESPWVLDGNIGVTRIESDSTRATQASESGGSYTQEQSTYQQARGVNNIIAPTTERIDIQGDNNIVYDYAQRINIMNSDNVIIKEGVKNVNVYDTNNVIISESNISYISGVKFSNGEMIATNPANPILIDGGYNELNNPFGDNTINVVDGGLNLLRDLGSDANFTDTDGQIN